jgi:FkbM family methyltransferase
MSWLNSNACIQFCLALIKRARYSVINVIGDVFPRYVSRQSFSQSGEDMIIDFALKAMRIENPSYLDIGANHPCIFNNTYYFYNLKGYGVTVEPDPALSALLKRKRPKDITLNIGVSTGLHERLPLYVMSNPTLNTFSESEALRYGETGSYKIQRVIDVELLPISEIFMKYFDDNSPDILSIDVEGMDYEIIKSIDFKKYRPVIICVETLQFSESREVNKISAINNYLSNYNYMVYADTHINTIFVDRQKWIDAR